jgi:5,10-methylenetetrahydromethanopterin reductase
MIKLGFEMAPEGVQETVSLVRMAERLNYKSAWFADSQLRFSEVHVSLTACACSTEKILLGTSVTNPLTRHPSVTASAAATLAELSGGRFILGIARGDSSAHTIGANPSSVKEFREALRMIMKLLSGEGYVTRERTWQLLIRKIRPKVHVACTGPQMLKLAGTIADGIMLKVGHTHQLYRYGMETARESAAEAGRNPDELDFSCFASVCVDEDRHKARELAKYFVARFLKVAPVMADYLPRDVTGIDRAFALEVAERFSWARKKIDIDEDVETAKKLIRDDLVDRYTIAGTPEDCVRQIKVAEQAGVSHLLMSLQPPNRRRELVEYVAENILPEFS